MWIIELSSCINLNILRSENWKVKFWFNSIGRIRYELFYREIRMTRKFILPHMIEHCIVPTYSNQMDSY